MVLKVKAVDDSEIKWNIKIKLFHLKEDVFLGWAYETQVSSFLLFQHVNK